MPSGRLSAIEPTPPPAEPPAARPAAPPIPLPSPPLANAELKIGLRPWGGSPNDATALVAAWNDPEIARWNQVPAERGEDDAVRWIAGEGGRRDHGVAVDLVIFELGDPAKIHGEVGLVVVEPEKRWAEIGFWLHPASRGAGRARGAVTLLTGWAFEKVGISRVVGRTDAANPRAAWVLAACGFTQAGVLDDGHQVWVRDDPHL